MKIPYSLAVRWERLKGRPYLGGATSLPPIEVPSTGMAAELHMMLGHHHLLRGMVTLETFYRYSGLADRVGLMIHLDGSVGKRGRRWLAKRFPGAAFTDFPSTDPRVAEALAERPYCRSYYERKVSCMTRLVHMPLLARSPRVIQMDSDIVFFDRPQAIVDWVDDPSAPPLYQRDWRRDVDPGPEGRQGFATFLKHLDRYTGRIEMRDYFVCAGLILFEAKRFSFDLVEDYLKWHATAGPDERPKAFWFSDWTVELTGFMLNFNAWPDARPLDETYAIGAEPSQVCNHYFGGSLYHMKNLRRIKATLDALRGMATPAMSRGRNITAAE